jgi:hypothetical protein
MTDYHINIFYNAAIKARLRVVGPQRTTKLLSLARAVAGTTIRELWRHAICSGPAWKMVA